MSRAKAKAVKLVPPMPSNDHDGDKCNEMVRGHVVAMRNQLVELAIYVASVDSGEHADATSRIVCDAFGTLNRMSTELLDDYLSFIDRPRAKGEGAQ
jgi:hypothetical protein